MRNPIHVLKSLEEKASVSNNKYERLYRNLYNPEFYLLAYANIAKSQGSMTQGVDGQTLDNMSLPRINRIIESIRNRTYPVSYTHLDVYKRQTPLPTQEKKIQTDPNRCHNSFMNCGFFHT